VKKALLSIAVILFLLIGALIALPFIFKDEIIAEVKKAANESLTAKVDFKDFVIFLNSLLVSKAWK
jgi:Ca2+-binding EF-hand superfamily protein